MQKVTKEIHPPQNNSYTELLRFYCQTSDIDDPSLPFMASMWSYSIANDGGLTGRQQKAADVYITHRLKQYNLTEVLNHE